MRYAQRARVGKRNGKKRQNEREENTKEQQKVFIFYMRNIVSKSWKFMISCAINIWKKFLYIYLTPELNVRVDLMWMWKRERKSDKKNGEGKVSVKSKARLTLQNYMWAFHSTPPLTVTSHDSFFFFQRKKTLGSSVSLCPNNIASIKII